MKTGLITKSVLLSVLLIAIDQFSKHLIRSLGGFYVCNKDIAFGIKIPEIFSDSGTIILIAALIYILYKKYFIHDTLYIILILSGAISNIIDRLFFGCVIDFIDLKFWPVFNLADVFITGGAILLLAKYLKSYYNSKRSPIEKTK